MPSFEEYCEEIKELWDSRWLTNNGAKHQLFEQQLKEYLHTPNVTLYTNGHLALENIIEAMHFPKGGEVITTPFTFVSTTHAIVRSGLTPVFCDIKYDDYTIDESMIENLITDKTCAIIPVHVYGNVCNVEVIQQIANKYSLVVIYDAAHSFGVTYKGVSTANFGDVSMFSFHATKVFNTIEGGAVCYRDSSLSQTLNDIKNFGIHGPETTRYIGGNAKMNEFQAAMGICNLRHLYDEIEKRRIIAEQYKMHLNGIKGIKLNVQKEYTKSNFAYFPVVFDDYRYTRDDVFDMLKQNDIFSRKYFYPLTTEFECYKEFGFSNCINTPMAKYISKHVLCLPMYADLTLDTVDEICRIILGKNSIEGE